MTPEQTAREKALEALAEIELLFCNGDKDTYMFNKCNDIIRTALKSQASSWSSMESAPRDGTYILLSDGKHAAEVGNCVFDAKYFDVYRQMWDKSWFLERRIAWSPTHWTPLPSPPTQTSADGGG